MRMAPFTCTLLTLFFTSFALQEGCGLPLSDQAALPAPEERPRHIRTKRCSCSNWEDKECIYFCHLDIIWVNTPSKVLPFGLGGPPSRRRRSAERCRCLDPADASCSGFCSPRSEHPKSALRTAGTLSKNLLATFRTVVKSNMFVASKKRLRSRTIR
ncbi:endothelin-2 [Takifugu rubripes]|uniref:Endothelin 2 n=1 Tax=Takifugu rubripes TaxID=31033 RepID=A0A3B5KFS9_TAKRU|nr:endothelin-2-like [Takifugu rubripes]|eukprot:XP_003969159.2 PREDICTED: endothelin-2-like [Takifugu rubripes]